MHSWWVVGPVSLSAVLLRGVFGRRSTHRRGKKDEDSTREEGSLAFTCERVCTSEALLKRLGSLAKVQSGSVHLASAVCAETPLLTRTAPHAGPNAKHVRDGVRHVRCAQSFAASHCALPALLSNAVRSRRRVCGGVSTSGVH
jgi:hypothetical protein